MFKTLLWEISGGENAAYQLIDNQSKRLSFTFQGPPETEISVTKVLFEKYVFKDLNKIFMIFQK